MLRGLGRIRVSDYATVTYTHHFTGESPDWTIDPVWLQRVEDVVDMALERDLYVITNVHHGTSVPSVIWHLKSIPSTRLTMEK